MAEITKGTTLSYKASGGQGSTYTELTNIKSIGQVGNKSKSKIDVTTLASTAKEYIDGLADSQQDLTVQFIYEETQFLTISALGRCDWKIVLPNTGLEATFSGTPTVALDSIAPDGALTYTMTITLDTTIAFT